jgi:protein-tyrosine phosphatase
MGLFWMTDTLAVATRPRGGDWLRDELTGISAHGVSTLVSCLTEEEESDLELESEAAEAQSLGLEFIPVPIADQETPGSGVVEGALSQLRKIGAEQGRVAIHCRQGSGRSPLIAAAVLVRSGLTADEAWATVARARGRPVPETEAQREWLRRFAPHVTGR